MRTRTQLSHNAAESLHIAVVDPQWKDYANLLEEFARANVNLHFLHSGRDALRFAQTQRADLWVVSVRPFDRSGLDLTAMLKDHWPQSVIYVVADKYCVEDEQAAWTCGASLFVCKPVLPDVFERIGIRPARVKADQSQVFQFSSVSGRQVVRKLKGGMNGSKQTTTMPALESVHPTSEVILGVLQ
jgi:DNA-binding response OmpR family regulator